MTNGIGNETVNGRIPRPLLRAALAGAVALLSVFVMGWGAIVWNGTRAAELKNAEQDEQIKHIRSAIDRFDSKLDRLLERRP